MKPKLFSTASITDRVTLSDGNTMPVFGLGHWLTEGDVTYNAAIAAIEAGYRLFDTAQYYKNEHMVGNALRDSGLARNEYFVVTKVDPQNHGYITTKMSLMKSLELLKLDFVDLFLIHSPHGGKNLETWKAICELKEDGLAKSIGVSNFNIQHLEAFSANGLERPAVDQFELHPWNQYKNTVKYCRDNGITVMGYCPLARGQKEKSELIEQLCEKYDKSRAQILLKWAVQSKFITIPKSANKDRIKENADIFSWTLVDTDMDLIAGLDEQYCVGSWNAHMLGEWAG